MYVYVYGNCPEIGKNVNLFLMFVFGFLVAGLAVKELK